MKTLDTKQVDCYLQVNELAPGFCEEVDNNGVQPSFVTVTVDGNISETTLTKEPRSQKI